MESIKDEDNNGGDNVNELDSLKDADNNDERTSMQSEESEDVEDRKLVEQIQVDLEIMYAFAIPSNIVCASKEDDHSTMDEDDGVVPSTSTLKEDEMCTINKEEVLGKCERFERNVRRLLQSDSVDVTHHDRLQNNLLHYAVMGNSMDLVKQIIDRSSDTLKTRNQEGMTPLHIAALLDYSDIAVELINKLEDINMENEFVMTPILTAAYYDSRKVFEILRCKNACIYKKDLQGNSVLHLATAGNNINMLEILFSSEDEARYQETMQMLDSKNSAGDTALHIAVRNGFLDGIKVLLNCEDGAHSTKTAKLLQSKNSDGDSALHIAVRNNFKEGVKILLNCIEKAHFTEIIKLLQSKNLSGNTVLHVAVQKEFIKSIKILLNCEDKTRFRDYIRLLFSVNAEKETTLHLATQKGFLECTEMLIEKCKEWSTTAQPYQLKALLDLQNSKERTALHNAVISGSKEIVELILQEHTNTNLMDATGRTPLSYAAEEGLVYITKMLIAHEAEAEIKDVILKMPIHYAAENGHSDVVRILLKENGACGKTSEGSNCLDIAILFHHVETALVIIKSKKWKELLRNQTREYQSPMRKLILDMPDVAREVCNRCTSVDGVSDHFSVKFDYEFLDDTFSLARWVSWNVADGVPYTDDARLIKRNHPLMIMVTKKRAELLDHPLVSALLKNKWTSVGLILYLLNVLLYVLYLTMLTGFALSVKAPYQFPDFSAESNVCFKDNKIPQFAAIAKYFVPVLAAIELFIEILEIKLMYSCKVWLYLMQKENILEWITCSLSILFVMNFSDCTDAGFRPQWQWTCGTISVFLAWLNLLLLIQKFDLIGIYVVMLSSIAKVFLKFFLVFSLLIVAFAVTFHCLLQNQGPFSNFWISLVKTTGMMVGELEYTTIFLDGEVHFNVISHVFFYIFMLFMTIVVVNLMVGLAVDNIQEFQSQAGLTKKTMQVKFALELERLSTSWLFRKVSTRVQCCKKNERDAWLDLVDEDEENSEIETLAPNAQNWLQKKVGESWKLTEKDIRAALDSGIDGFSTEIAQLKKEMKNMDSELMTPLRKELRVACSKSDIQEEIRNMETNLMAELIKVEGKSKADMQKEIRKMETKWMSQFVKEKGKSKANIQEEIRNMEARLMSRLNKHEEKSKADMPEEIRSINAKLMTIIQNLEKLEQKTMKREQE